MPPTPRDPDQLLAQLEAAKNRFGSGHATLIANLLAQLTKLQFTDPHHLIRFHECLLFLRAFPHAPSQVARVEKLLDTFHRRIEKLRASQADMSAFDDFDTSGISGTTMQDVLSFDVAQWLVRRIPRNVGIAWKDYWDDFQAERARAATWPRFIPLLEEDADVEANIPWSDWIDAVRGREPALSWLLKQFAKLPLPARGKSELYDSLRLPIRWKLEDSKLSRTRNWSTPRHFYFHDAPHVGPGALVRGAKKDRSGANEGVHSHVSRALIQRNEVSLARELARPAPKLEKLSLAAGERVMQHIREIMVVRYRELYGTTFGDPRSAVRADLGRGVVMYFWGLPPTRRLPLRAYLAGYTLKNGVPINYIEAIGLCEWIEVGFNTFYTYRQGETAWIYAQALRCLRALTNANCFSIYPYQIGQNNDEAIDSGAFWFYRKLGFRPGRPDLQKLCEREEQRIAAKANYRTPPRTLKRLAEAPMFYEPVLRGHGFSRAVRITKRNAASAAENATGAWDTFSLRTLALKINRRGSRELQSDSEKARRASTAAVVRSLNINPTRWVPTQLRALENYSLLLSQIPTLAHWTPAEKQQLIRIIRAKSGRDEMAYLRETQRHPRLRSELLGLGSA